MIRRLAHVCIDLALVGLLAAGVLVGLGFWRLSQGPVSLGFARPYFDQALAGVAAPDRIRLGDVVLTWGGWRRPLEIRAIAIDVNSEEGRVLATIPEISVSLAFRALIAGEIRPTRLGLIGPAATVTREVDGAVTLGLSGPDGAILPLEAADLMGPGVGSGIWSGLRQIGIHRARVRIEDRRLGLSWTAGRAAVGIVKDDGGVRATFEFDARLGEASASIAGTIARDAASGTTDVVADLAGVRPDRFAVALAETVPAARDLRGLAAPLDGAVRARIDPTGAVEALRFSLAGGPGAVTHPALGRHAFAPAGFSATGSYDGASGLLSVHRMEIDLGGPRLTLRGKLSGIGGRAGVVSGTAGLTGMTLQALPRYWPPAVAKGARAWIVENLDRGGIEDVNAEFAFRLPAAELIRANVTLALSGTRVHYLRPLEPAVDVDASVRIGPDRVEIAVKRGFLREMEIEEGVISISGLSSGKSGIAVETALRGALRSALEILDHPRFGYAGRLGLMPARVGGQAAMRIAARFPAIAALAFDDVEIGANGRLEALSTPDALPGRDLTDGSFSASVDARGMRISGKARISGIAADIDWSERFDGLGPFRSRYDVRARLDETARARLGVDLAPIVIGPVGLAASHAIAPDGVLSTSGTLDLGAATLEIAPLDWLKPPGRKAEATFELGYEGETVRSVRVGRIRAADLDASGTIAMKSGGGIAAIDIGRLAIGDRTDIAGRIARDGETGWAVTATGRRFDAGPLVRRVDEPVGDALPPMRIRAGFQRMTIRPGEHIDAARIDMHRDIDGWRRIVLEGRFSNAKTVRVDYAAGPPARLAIDSEDAGRALKLFGILERIRDGRLSLNAEKPAGGPDETWRGRLLVRQFLIADVPVLARALGVASFGTLRKSLDGTGIRFHRLELPFRYDGARLRIRNGKALGRELGMTGRGTIDLKERNVDFRGTLIPAYTLNSALGSIPGFGRLFAPEKGGGLFAATFNVAGPFDRLSFSFNPLAALAPGILRGLLKGVGPGADTPEDDASVPN